MFIKWVMIISLLNAIAAQDCDYFQQVEIGRTYTIYSPRWPSYYTGALQCRWVAGCPAGYNCRLDCPEINIPESPSCTRDRLLVSKSGDLALAGAESYCSRGSLTAVSTGQRITMALITPSDTRGGRFRCNVSAQRAVPDPICRCGDRKQNRIVGGNETGVNEYRMMIGLVDVPIRQIKCGAVIISKRHVLTAAHCVQGKSVDDILVLAGEHNVDLGDSPYTQGYRVLNYVIHNQYNNDTFDYDIAILTIVRDIEFNQGVGPVCLPFKFANSDLTGQKVTLLGWGTTDFGAPSSSYLQKVDVNVANQNSCRMQVPSVTNRQICTFSPGKDACQDDSGGPVLFTDPATGLLYSVGIISSGQSCATTLPGVNTRITMFLNWIVANTPGANFCVK